ncbi:MAG: SdrD B-like domain-containing protein [Umezawaea sp.]
MPAPEPAPEPAPVPDMPAPSVPGAAAEVADPGVTVKVDGGPYLVGQSIPVEITVTNHGTATATNVRAYNLPVSGSYLSINSYGPLSSTGTTGASIAAGEKLVVNTDARVYNWQGAPVARFTIYSSSGDSSYQNNNFDVAVPMTAPDSGKGSISGLIYGDANGNGSADVGEGLPGVQVTLSDGTLDSPKVNTGADGRFKFSDLALRNYGVYAHEAPDGWVLPNSGYVNVDGDEYLEYRAVRPLSDQLGASIAFTEDTYAVGQTAEMTVVLTNKGGTEISGIKAGCDRSGGEGPHVVDMGLGDLAWNGAGVTVGAGRSRTLTITGVVPAKALGFGAVSVACDFGPGDSPQGYPAVSDEARVPGAGPGSTWGVLYHDRDGDLSADADELLAGVKVGAVDQFSGQVVAKATTDAAGRLEFTNLPAGPYNLKLYGPWKFQESWAGFNIGTCGMHCGGGWYFRLVPGPDVPDTDLPPTTTPPTTTTPTTTTPTTTTSPTAPPAPAGGGSAGGATTGGGLAHTGVNTVGLMAFGLLSLIVGLGAVVATRRRFAA